MASSASNRQKKKKKPAKQPPAVKPAEKKPAEKKQNPLLSGGVDGLLQLLGLAFDTLGESHVLFTALMCVMILLKNTPNSTVTDPGEKLFDLRDDVPLRNTVRCVFPFVVMFGAYVLLAGHLGPGGGFSGGAILGAGMILLSCSYGDEKTGVFFNEKIFKAVSCTALCFYSLSKTYSFYTGANDLESIIPKGTPGAILSAGLILPLDIAVGLVVACTMFGFYSLFTKGKI